MQELLDHCRGWVPREITPGSTLLREGERSGQLYVLVDGALVVFRGDAEIAIADEPGAVFGEMSVLLDIPHTASVRAVSAAKVHVIEDAPAFLQTHPSVALPLAKLLARRLQNATTYLVDLKRQFQGHQDHFGMVDEVLESLTHAQDEPFPPASDLPSEP